MNMDGKLLGFRMSKRSRMIQDKFSNSTECLHLSIDHLPYARYKTASTVKTFSPA